MKLPIASLRKKIFISIVYGRVNISHHGSLPGTTSSVLTFFSVSRSHLLNTIVVVGITLNFLRHPKAKDVTAPRIQKKVRCRIYFGRKNALWDRWDFCLRDPFGNSHILRKAFGRLHQKLDARVASSIRKRPYWQLFILLPSNTKLYPRYF